MTIYQATITNGTASIEIPTTDITIGTHNITARYNQNDNYKSSNTTATLNIIEETTQHTINIDDYIIENGALAISASTDATIPEFMDEDYPTEDTSVLGGDYNILLLIRTNTQKYYVISLDADNISDETVANEYDKFTTTYSNFDIVELNYSSNPDLIASIFMQTMDESSGMVAMNIMGIDGTDAEIYFCLATPTEVLTTQTNNWNY